MPRPITKAQRLILNMFVDEGPCGVDKNSTAIKALVKRGFAQELSSETGVFIVSATGWKEVQS